MESNRQSRPSRILVYLSLAILFAVFALMGQGTVGFGLLLLAAVFFELRFWVELLRALRRDPIPREGQQR